MMGRILIAAGEVGTGGCPGTRRGGVVFREQEQWLSAEEQAKPRKLNQDYFMVGLGTSPGPYVPFNKVSL